MNITAANLDALFKTFQTKFSEAQKAAQTRVTPNDLVPEDIAISFTGSGSATQHSWLNQIKGIHEWVNQRVINALNLGKLTVVNRDFENTVTVSRNEIEDDQYGVYAPLIGMMGADAENLWKKLALEALLGNGEWADGNKFFCSGRKLNPERDETITNAVTTAFSKAALEAASRRCAAGRCTAASRARCVRTCWWSVRRSRRRPSRSARRTWWPRTARPSPTSRRRRP